MSIKRLLKGLIKISLIIVILVFIVTVYANWKIPHDTKDFIYTEADSIPKHSVGLILGTSRYIGSTPNIYFTNRIKAAKELYDTGKMDAFVVSGDNRHKSYNEPREMRRALVEVGVPDSIIHSDYAGFRTLDSVVRMGEVFGQKSFIVISQGFHNERAIFIAQYYGLEAYGYNARDLGLNRASYRTKAREILARVKVFVDIIMGTGPKFLGEPIDISNPSYNTECIGDSLKNATDTISIQ